MPVKPVAAELFAAGSLDDPAGPRLIAARRRADGKLHFPCPPAMDPAEWDIEELPQTGTLWSFTIQRFRLKSPPYAGPEAFTPYAVGYVELPGAIIVESRIVGVPFERLRIGMGMKLVTEPIVLDGETRIGFAFTSLENAA
jgi:uncharacterized OB-fold protein